MTTFAKWLDTFVEEKQLDLEQTFAVEGPEWGTNWIPLGVVVEAMKQTATSEQKMIRDTIVHIDFRNGDPMPFFKHLAKAMAK